jgi:hypothetical protein
MIKMVGRDSKGNNVEGSRNKSIRILRGPDCESTPQDPIQIAWMKRAMEDAIDWMFQFGMCPFRMVIDAKMQPRIIIPAYESGNFIARINEVGEIEVEWHTYTDGIRKTNELQPDRHVGVYVWSKCKPMLDTYNPFTSVVARIRKDNLRVQLLWRNMLYADAKAAYVPLVTRSVEQPRDVSHMNWDEALGDALAFDPNNQTLDERERTRMDDDAMYRSGRIRAAAEGQSDGPSVIRTCSDGSEVMESIGNPWFHSELPMPQGRMPATVTVPRPRTDILNFEEWLEKRATSAMRVPLDAMTKGGSGNKSATETETSNRLFRGAVKNIRDAVTEFVEEAWAQSMGKIEEEIIISGLDRLLEERRVRQETSYEHVDSPLNAKDKRQNGEKKSTRVPSTEEFSDTQRERWLKGQPGGPQTPGELERNVIDGNIANMIERETTRIIKRAQTLHVPIEPASVYRDVKDLVEKAGRKPDKTVNSQYLDVADELARQRGEKPEGDTSTPPRTDTSDLDAEERILKRALRQRRRLKVFWILPPVLDTGDIVFLHKEGAINDEVRNAVLFSKLDLPLDTPKGVSHEEHMLKVKSQLEMAKLKQTHKNALEMSERSFKMAMEKNKRREPTASSRPVQEEAMPSSKQQVNPTSKRGGVEDQSKSQRKRARTTAGVSKRSRSTRGKISSQ